MAGRLLEKESSMSRFVRRIAVAVLLGAALAPGLAVASAGAEGSGARGVLSAFQVSWEPFGRLWSWLNGVRPQEGCSSDPNGGPPCMNHPAKTKGTAAGRPSPPVRPTEGCTIDPNGHCGY
jgi:hypothetical protein